MVYAGDGVIAVELERDADDAPAPTASKTNESPKATKIPRCIFPPTEDERSERTGIVSRFGTKQQVPPPGRNLRCKAAVPCVRPACHVPSGRCAGGAKPGLAAFVRAGRPARGSRSQASPQPGSWQRRAHS